MSYDLSVQRHIDAAPAEVWSVMTDRIAEWWCPKPWTTTVEELEWRNGGAFHLTMRGPNGEADCKGEANVGGVLLDVTPGKRFVFTDALSADWQPQAVFIVGLFEIEPDGDGTLYRATARHWTAEAMQKHREMGFDQGWGAVADQLAVLAEGANVDA
jgi:uncharacterized protein YndB with AHSA1/START domain